MAKLVWALLCRRVIVDQPTNLVSYVDALDGFNIPEFPHPAPLIAVCTVWQRDSLAEDIMRMRAVVYSPAGDPVMRSEENELRLEPQHKRARMNSGVLITLPAVGR